MSDTEKYQTLRKSAGVSAAPYDQAEKAVVNDFPNRYSLILQYYNTIFSSFHQIAKKKIISIFFQSKESAEILRVS